MMTCNLQVKDLQCPMVRLRNLGIFLGFMVLLAVLSYLMIRAVMQTEPGETTTSWTVPDSLEATTTTEVTREDDIPSALHALVTCKGIIAGVWLTKLDAALATDQPYTIGSEDDYNTAVANCMDGQLYDLVTTIPYGREYTPPYGLGGGVPSNPK